MRLLFSQLRPGQKALVAFIFCCSAVSAAAGSMTAVLLYSFVSLMQFFQGGALPADTVWDGALAPLAQSGLTPAAQLGILCALTVGCALVSFGVKIACRARLIALTSQMTYLVRSRVYRRVLEVREEAFHEISPASAVNRVNNDMYMLQEAAVGFYVYFYETAWSVVLTVVFSLMLSPLLSSVYAAFVPLCAAIVLVADLRAERHYDRNLEVLDGVNQVVRENIRGFQIVKSFNLQARQYARFRPLNEEWRRTIVRSEFIVNAAIIAMFFVLNAAIIAILFLCGHIVSTGAGGAQITAGVAIAFVNYAISTVYNVYGLTSTVISLVRVKPVIKRTKEFLATPAEDLDAGTRDADFRAPLVFKNVSYAYPGQSGALALKNVSFTVAPGAVVGVVGPSGAGKTTLAGMIARLAEPTAGEISWGETPLRDISLRSLRAAVGYAPQERLAFAGTIASNIRHGKPDATDEELRTAAAEACALDFVDSDPAGFGRAVSQYGLNLSGGQRQRLSLARALVRRPALLVLDDTLSALDNITRDRALANLKRNYAGMTQLIVAQQVKTVRHADLILVLDSGELVGSGTHERLLRECPLYAQIAASQRTAEEE